MPQSNISVLARQGLDELDRGEVNNASLLINQALKLDVTNADLHFLNGLIYHLMGAAGDSSNLELAEQGYTRALKFDPGHYPARYQLGRLYMDQRNYSAAQAMFASVALNRWSDPDILYSLGTASYYARDPLIAEAAFRRLSEVSPEMAGKPRVLRAAAVSMAAANDPEAARGYLATYRNAVGDKAMVREIEQRIDSWDAFYRTDAPMILAQFNMQMPGVSDQPFAMPGATTMDQGITGSQFASDDMVVVDVVLIGTQEDIRNSRGVNLLNGLQLQFGDPLNNIPGYSFSSSKTSDYAGQGTEANTRTITRALTIPAVTYSLNIANALDADNEIMAKPSLVALSGQTSEFFSGTEVLAAAVSGGQGDSVSVQKEVGVKLAITPEAMPDDKVRLHVVAQRTFLTDPASSVVFQFRLDTSKTTINSTVNMHYGETLILGGLLERENSKSLNGVPGLRDVPGLNLFFSEKIERKFQRSILILLTPRRPQYTSRAPERRQQDEDQMSQYEKDLERLTERHKSKFNLRPTFSNILDKIQGRTFFNEFQNGDIQPEAWNRNLENQDHVAQVWRRLSQN